MDSETTLERVTSVIRGSRFVCLAFGVGRNFMLFPVAELPISDECREIMARCGYVFAGICGYRDGQPVIGCEPGQEASFTMLCAADAYGAYVAAQLKQEEPVDKSTSTDGADWLERLYQLPDTRG